MPGEVPDRCRAYRIAHFDNLAGTIKQGGMWSGAEVHRRGLPYVQIGLQTLTLNRKEKPVPVAAEGYLCDYVPFHFCARPVMLYQIHKGEVSTYQGGQEPILHFITTVERVQQLGLSFAFTDRHAKTSFAEFFDDPAELYRLDWNAIKSTDFRVSISDPDRPTRKEAEFLVHRFVPLTAIVGIATYSRRWKDDCERLLKHSGIQIPVQVKPSWYY